MSDLEQDKLNFLAIKENCEKIDRNYDSILCNLEELKKIEVYTQVIGSSIAGAALGTVIGVMMDEKNCDNNPVRTIRTVSTSAATGAGIGASFAYFWYN